MNQYLTRGRMYVALFTGLYILGFGAWFIAQGNSEFLWYVATMLVIIAVVVATIPTSKLGDGVLWLLSIWGLLHMLGGGVQVGDHVLYGHVLYPFVVDGDFTILKYDQVVHGYGFAVAAAAIHGIISRMAPMIGRFGRIWIAALASMGLSVINEIIEFMAVVFLPNTWVGGYYNVSLDLVFNTLGAFLAVIIIEMFRRKA